MRLLMLALAASTVVGCKTRCDSNLDCESSAFCAASGRCEIECFDNLDCRVPLECRANPANCASKGLYCTQRGKCVGPIVAPGADVDFEDKTIRASDGWTDPPGTGPMFVINSLAVADCGDGLGLDAEDGIDNSICSVGQHVNNAIRQGLQGGEVMLLIEIAGLESPYTGDEESVTVKFYRGRDADNDRGNNFRIPINGQGPCCEFNIDINSVVAFNERLLASQMVPARIEGGKVISQRGLELEFALTVDRPPYNHVVLDQSQVVFNLYTDLSRIEGGVLGGALTASSLIKIESAFSNQSGALLGDTLYHVAAGLVPGHAPDIDLDADGLECALDTNGDLEIDVCCDGVPGERCQVGSNSCPGPEIMTADPKTCPSAPEFADGFSAALLFTAVKARVLGIAQ